ncbi:MAG: hypothetical protein IPO88_21020 [Nannocystis sp.]|uniref:hypothetical protein n=1 Tax=Nannocystis sp. TaxID=1962667 RepID=UPI002427A863|nr:hypothetical protein [Nannocystis sp.]MBK9755934.1 hypothetical protein [Nannocystis sp.]
MKTAERLERMLAVLPRALRGGRRIASLLGAAAAELSADDRSLERGLSLLMRSRWPALARGWLADADPHETPEATELARIAALLGVEPLPGESVTLFRRRLHQDVLLHRQGLCTAPALLARVAMLYLPEHPPTIAWEDELAVATVEVRDARGQPCSLRLEVVDNPTRRCAAGPAVSDDPGPASPDLLLHNGGLTPARPELVLLAGAALSLPELHHLESDLRLVFLGTLAAGDRLVLRPDVGPTVNGRPSPAPLVVSSPTRFDSGVIYCIDEIVDGAPLTRGARFSRSERWQPGDDGFPELACGANHLRCRSVPLPELAALIDHWPDRAVALAAVAAPRDNPRLAVHLGARWHETPAACFSLRVPADIVPWHRRNEPALHWRALRECLEASRAAGIAATLDTQPPRLRDALVLAERVHVHVQIGRRDDLDLHAASGIAGRPALTPGVFDASAYDQAFAEAHGDDDDGSEGGAR